MLIGTGVYQFTFGAVPMYNAFGVDIKDGARQALHEDVFGPIVAISAISARSEYATNIVFGCLLAYVAYLFPFEMKGPLHLFVAVWAGLHCLSYHLILKDIHSWGPLALTDQAVHMLSLMRIVFVICCLFFWILAVLSWTFMYTARKNMQRFGNKTD